jgi:tyrosyl-tRNA synthetase
MKSLDEIAALEAEMKAKPEARIPQKALAEELTRLVHGEEGLKKAQEATEALYAKKTAADVAKADNVPSANVALADCVGKPVFAVAAAAGMFKSNGEARRMAQQGGLSINDGKADVNRVFAETDVKDGVAVLRSGKKNYFVLRIS